MPPSSNIPYGFCHCDCGQRTLLAEKNHTRSGAVKGQPTRYIFNHHRRALRPKSKLVTIGDVIYRTIPLTKEQVAVVDVEDYERLAVNAWHARRSTDGSCFYATRTELRGGKNVHIQMHHEVLGVRTETDHRDGDGLHNWKKNLRPATHMQNAANRKMQSNNTSGFPGVWFDKKRGVWCGELKVNGKKYHVPPGTDVAVVAARVASKSIELRGEFARV